MHFIYLNTHLLLAYPVSLHRESAHVCMITIFPGWRGFSYQRADDDTWVGGGVAIS